MRVAVLGGGFQGCCIALALSMRGVRVTIFDRGQSLMSRTAVANEGKVHLGYMYAADPSLKTARKMIDGALSFGPFLAQALEKPQSSFATSQPTVYLVHRESQCDAGEAIDYLSKTHDLIREKANGARGLYFGQDLQMPLEQWSREKIAECYDPATVLAAVATPEIAIDPIDVMNQLRDRIEDDPLIEICLEHEITNVDAGRSGLSVSGSSNGGSFARAFDHVVNALWEGRLAIDAKMGLMPGRPWLHRLKHGISLQIPEVGDRPRSCTIISGPFGEVVNYASGTVYLTWYPHCVTELSPEITPPFWDTYPRHEVSQSIVSSTVASMGEFIWKLREVSEKQMAEARVKGGPIFAWGSTDIHDPASELHRRYEIGVHSHGNYHSVDPGKLTMAPHFATGCASRIVG